MGPDGMLPQVSTELAAVACKASPDNLWWLREFPQDWDWKKANVLPVLKKGKKEDFRELQAVSLTSVPGKVIKQMSPEIVFIHKG